MADFKPRSDTRVVVFRVDASLQIGSGHVSRCLALAEALRGQGLKCHFICREHHGHLVHAVRARGFVVHALRSRSDGAPSSSMKENGQSAEAPRHYGWLNASWEQDAADCREVLAGVRPDWIIVDHYALDSRWEEAVSGGRAKILVIDDLADRPHISDVLLDQSLGRLSEDYAHLVPARCVCLIGPRFALLRPEFPRLRQVSLARRRAPELKELLITMGGVDKDNATGEVLSALSRCELPDDCRIRVVMGAGAPWLPDIQERAALMPRLTEVLVDIDDMATKMMEADVAIGAAGSTSWERCCLGLPTLLVTLAYNQQGIADALNAAGAAVALGSIESLAQLPERWAVLTRTQALISMSQRSARITEGNGASIVSTLIEAAS